MADSVEKRRRWTEEETILALYLYFQLPFGKLHSKTPEIQQLAIAIGRSSDSVAMKLCNFASLDPKITESGRKGLSGASKLDRDAYLRFGQNWTGLVAQANSLWERLVGPREISEELDFSHKLNDVRTEFQFEPFVGETVRQGRVSQRLGQGFFRRAVLANYEECCCVTGIADTRLLVASHIMPWGKSVENRHNPANGFLLSATVDKAFDQGLITINRMGRVQVSRQLLQSESGPTRTFFSPFEGAAIRSAVRFPPDPSFLDWHVSEVFLDSRKVLDLN